MTTVMDWALQIVSNQPEALQFDEVSVYLDMYNTPIWKAISQYHRQQEKRLCHSGRINNEGVDCGWQFLSLHKKYMYAFSPASSCNMVD